MRKLTEKEFIEKVGNKVQVIGNYLGHRTNIKVKCLICNNVWEPKAGSLCKGYGCPQCGLKKAFETKKWNISQEQFLKKIPKDFLATIEVLGKYSSQHCDVEVKCRGCLRNWISTPYYLYRKYGCDFCARKKKGIDSRKSHEKFLKEVFDFHGDSIKVVGVYVKGDVAIKVNCNQCGYEWDTLPQRITRRGCPICATPRTEKRIANFLNELKINYKQQFGFDDLKSEFGVKLRFDFAIFNEFELHSLIEYDGVQHFKAIEYMGGIKRFERQKANDELKNNYCNKNGIKLIRIPYYDLKITNKERLKCLIDQQNK